MQNTRLLAQIGNQVVPRRVNWHTALRRVSRTSPTPAWPAASANAGHAERGSRVSTRVRRCSIGIPRESFPDTTVRQRCPSCPLACSAVRSGHGVSRQTAISPDRPKGAVTPLSSSRATVPTLFPRELTGPSENFLLHTSGQWLSRFIGTGSLCYRSLNRVASPFALLASFAFVVAAASFVGPVFFFFFLHDVHAVCVGRTRNEQGKRRYRADGFDSRGRIYVARSTRGIGPIT